MNSLWVGGRIVVFLLSRIASTGFPTNVYGDIDFDVVTESGSKGTAPTKGECTYSGGWFLLVFFVGFVQMCFDWFLINSL